MDHTEDFLDMTGERVLIWWNIQQLPNLPMRVDINGYL